MSSNNPEGLVFSSEESQRLEMISEIFAGYAEKALSKSLRSRFQLSLVALESVSYEEALSRYESHSPVIQIGYEPYLGISQIQLDWGATSSIIELLLGGESKRPIAMHTLSIIETALLESMMRLLLPHYRRAWSYFSSANPDMVSIESETDFLKIIPRSCPCLLLTYTLGSESGKMRLLYPALGIPALLNIGETPIQNPEKIVLEAYEGWTLNSMIKASSEFVLHNPEIASTYLHRFLRNKENENAAIFMVSIGAEVAALLYRQMIEKDIKQLTFDIGALGKIDATKKRAVFSKWLDWMENPHCDNVGNLEYAVSVLEKAFGMTKATDFMKRLNAAEKLLPFDFLANYSVREVYMALYHEHPQTVALLLFYMPPDRGGELLAFFELEKQADILERVSRLKAIDPDILQTVDKITEHAFEVLLQPTLHTENVEKAGVLLSKLDSQQSIALMDYIHNHHAHLEIRLGKNNRLLEESVHLSDAEIKEILSRIDKVDLAKTMGVASERFHEKIYRNIDIEWRKRLEEEIKRYQNASTTEIEASQNIVLTELSKFLKKAEDSAQGSEAR